jgi:tripartite-type tricarboxylate transporter receptor subunit TctC
MRRLLALCAVAAAAVLGAPAQAQDFPSKLIHIIVPFTPGGSNDVLARELAAGFQARWKESAIVENRPGGGGIIAYTFVAKAPPDGYTLMVVPASFTMLPHLTRNPGFNPMTDYAPINLIIDVPFVMVVPPTVPAKTVREFIALAKASPGQMTYGSVGVGTPQHLGAELFKMHAGVDLIHVPYRGATAAIPDLLAGRMQMFIGAINSLLPLINEGKLTALASTGSKRVASLPDVPTIAETFPGFEIGSGVGLVAPAGTPAAIVNKLNAAIDKGLRSQEIQDKLAAVGAQTAPGSPQDFANFIASETVKWRAIAKTAGVSLD